MKAALGIFRGLVARRATETTDDMSPGESGGTSSALERNEPPDEMAKVRDETGGPGNSDSLKQEDERGRQPFFNPDLDEAVENLRSATAPADRAAAARSLGESGGELGKVHLVAALFDESPEVQKAAQEALDQLGGPTEAESANTDQQAPEPPSVRPSQSSSSPSSEPEDDESILTLEEKQLLQEEKTLRQVIGELEHRLVVVSDARSQLEKEAQLRREREGKLRAEAAARRLADEEARVQFEERAEEQRKQDNEAVESELLAARLNETEANRLATEEEYLRIEVLELRRKTEQLTRKRVEAETKIQKELDAASLAVVLRARNEAEAAHKSELNRLQNEEQAMRAALAQVALKRAETEAARQDEEAGLVQLADERQKLEDAQLRRSEEVRRLQREAEERIRAQEETLQAQLKEMRQQAEKERARLEAEIGELLETEKLRLEETLERAEDEKQRITAEVQGLLEEEERRIAELEATRQQIEAEAAQRAGREQQLLSQIESLRMAEAEARKRIVQAESLHQTLENSYINVAEQVQRVEAQAHARAVDEKQILAKLETARREAEIAAKQTAEREKQVRDEIEQFQRLEEEERPKLEAAILQRTEAEANLQQLRAQLSAEERLREAAEERFVQLLDDSGEAAPTSFERQQTEASLNPVVAEAPTSPTGEIPVNGGTSIVPDDNSQQTVTVEESDSSAVAPTIGTYLNSVDPYKRAAAVAELARGGGEDAFELITKSFDDHSPHVRNAAARALTQLEPGRGVDLFNRALEEASEQRRRNIGSAIATSGVATDAVNNLEGASREDTYNALCMLLIMAKTGEVQPLIAAIEDHEEEEVCRAATKILTLSGQSALAEAAQQRRARKRG